MAHLERVIVLVDMDCFYCQVEEKLNPEIKGKPVAVVQYNAWRGGGIIAVNYPARNKGVTRHMRGNDALQKCPEIVLCQVPCVRGKADLTKYRDAGKDVAEVLHKFTRLLERASVDEAYMDITESVNNRLKEFDKEITLNDLPTTYIYGCDKEEYLYNLYNNSIDSEPDLKLIMGAVIVEEIRAAVKMETGFECSAGIAHNKILAKLICGINKPNKQTVLPHTSVAILYRELPICKIKSLGGKFGESLSDDLAISYMSELEKFSEKYLQQKYDTKTGTWLYNIARGIDTEPVNIRLCPKSIGCCKRFPGKTSLRSPDDVQHWINELSCEISDRLTKELAENNRRATHMIVNYTLEINGKNISSSKSRPLSSYDHNKIAADAFEIIHKVNSMSGVQYKNPVTYLGVICGKFEDANQNIQNFFNTNKTNNTIAIPTSSEKTIRNIENEQVNLIVKPSCFGTSFFSNIFQTNSNKVITSTNIDSEIRLDNHHQQTSVIEKDTITETAVESVQNIIEDEYSEIPSGNNTNEKENQIKENLAEFQLCCECNKQILIADFEAHSDYHYALKIAGEEKLKNHNFMSFQSSVEIRSDKKIEEKCQEKNSTKTIATFFQKLHQTDENQEVEICSQCNQPILLNQFLEHLDYHTAKKLNNEINERKIVAISQTSKQMKVTKNKRNNKNDERNSNKKMKSIVNFFKTS